MINKKYKTTWILTLTLLFGSCDKYLMVDPKTSLSQHELFSSIVGFEQALTGVYAKLATSSLYGDNLTMGFVSAMAQNYSTANSNYIFKETSVLNTESNEMKSKLSAIWSNSYSAIAGLNNILEHLEGKETEFGQNAVNLLKGQALGLRALIHLDLVRLFGANALVEPNSKSIPYQLINRSSASAPLPVSEIYNLILKDLEQAADLLEKISKDVENGWVSRFRMNYWAVKALIARVALFKGDPDYAYKRAKEVIDSQRFKFVTVASVSSSEATKDRLFSTELILSLRVFNIRDWVESGQSYFRKLTDARSNLTRTYAEFSQLYETGNGGTTDFRFAFLIENHEGSIFPSKYWQTHSGDLNQTVPLIRLTEMYYIAAETSPDIKESITLLNEVRSNRGLNPLPEQNMDALKVKDEISKEYQKEFFAEGQLFYYYKRLRFEKMMFQANVFTDESYIMPIPNAELEYNNLFDKTDNK